MVDFLLPLVSFSPNVPLHWGYTMAKRRSGSLNAFLILLVIFLVTFLIISRLFWVPAGLAAVTVIIASPLYSRVLAVVRGRRYVAAAVMAFVVCGFILLPLGGVIVTMITELVRFSQHAIVQLQEGQLAAQIDQWNVWMMQWLARWGEFAPEDVNLRLSLIAAAKVMGKTLYQFSPKVLASTAHVGIATLLWLFFLFVFFADGPRLYRYMVELSALDAAHESVISKEVRGMVSAIFIGMVGTAFVNACLMALIIWFSPLQNPMVWGLITFGLSFIPVIGAASVWGFAAVYLLSMGQTWWSVGIAAYGMIFISQADNVVKPLLMRGRVDAHPLLLLISLLGGVEVFGPSGLVFGPVLLAMLLACLRIYRREFVL